MPVRRAAVAAAGVNPNQRHSLPAIPVVGRPGGIIAWLLATTRPHSRAMRSVHGTSAVTMAHETKANPVQRGSPPVNRPGAQNGGHRTAQVHDGGRHAAGARAAIEDHGDATRELRRGFLCRTGRRPPGEIGAGGRQRCTHRTNQRAGQVMVGNADGQRVAVRRDLVGDRCSARDDQGKRSGPEVLSQTQRAGW